MNAIKNFLLLLSYEWRLEWISGKRVMHFLGLGVLLSIFAALGLQSAFLAPPILERAFPLVFSLLVIVCNLHASQDVLHHELKSDVHEALRMFGVGASTLYTAKLFVSTFLSSLCAILIGASLLAFLQIHFSAWLAFFAVSLLSSLALSSISLLIAALSARSQASSLLFALLFLPLLSPIFFCLSELAMLFFQSGEAVCASFWFSLLFGIAVIYSLLGVLLFPYTIYKPI